MESDFQICKIYLGVNKLKIIHWKACMEYSSSSSKNVGLLVLTQFLSMKSGFLEITFGFWIKSCDNEITNITITQHQLRK